MKTTRIASAMVLCLYTVGVALAEPGERANNAGVAFGNIFHPNNRLPYTGGHEELLKATLTNLGRGQAPLEAIKNAAEEVSESYDYGYTPPNSNNNATRTTTAAIQDNNGLEPGGADSQLVQQAILEKGNIQMPITMTSESAYSENNRGVTQQSGSLTDHRRNPSLPRSARSTSADQTGEPRPKSRDMDIDWEAESARAESATRSWEQEERREEGVVAEKQRFAAQERARQQAQLEHDRERVRERAAEQEAQRQYEALAQRTAQLAAARQSSGGSSQDGGFSFTDALNFGASVLNGANAFKNLINSRTPTFSPAPASATRALPVLQENSQRSPDLPCPWPCINR